MGDNINGKIQKIFSICIVLVEIYFGKFFNKVLISRNYNFGFF